MSQINKDMKTKTVDPAKPVATGTGPRESAGLWFSSQIKITDTSTGKILLQKRCS
jgi:hypothetical protein